MSILEHPGSTETPTVAPSRPRAPTGLIVALVVALLAAIVSSTLLFVAQHTTGVEREAIEVVERFVDAINIDDRDALREVTTDDVVWSALTEGVVQVGPNRGESYVFFQTGIANFRLEVVGEPTVLGTQVSLPVNVNVADEDGFTVFTLREVEGELLIAEIYWLPQA
jgi:limonene-1,2-epoxide hydrolase